MDFDSLQNRRAMPEGDYSLYGVLVPMVEIDGQPHLLFEVRSKSLRRQPGEICFPGGKVDSGEAPQQASLRETAEELNISIDNVEVIGALDYLVTPFNLILYPYLGRINNIDISSLDFNKDEVEEIFTVPLKFFMDNPPLLHYIDMEVSLPSDFPHHLVEGGKNYKWKAGKYPVYFYQYQNRIIWGFTARIVNHFVDITRKENLWSK